MSTFIRHNASPPPPTRATRSTMTVAGRRRANSIGFIAVSPGPGEAAGPAVRPHDKGGRAGGATRTDRQSGPSCRAGGRKGGQRRTEGRLALALWRSARPAILKQDLAAGDGHERRG